MDVSQSWWRTFHDPALDRLAALAYQQNLTLQSAGTRVLQARAELGIAMGEIFPQQQQAAGSIDFNRASGADRPPRGNLKYYWRDALGFRLGWEIDFWGKFRRGIESADAAYLASIASYDDVIVTLTADVAEPNRDPDAGAPDRHRARERDAVARDPRDRRRAKQGRREQRARRLPGAGGGRELGGERSRTDAATGRKGENALRVLLGMEPESLKSLLARGSGRISAGRPRGRRRHPRRPPAPPSRRAAAELRAAAQSAQIGVAAADLYPAISITGVFGGLASNVGQANLSQVVKSAGLTYGIGPSFQWNLLNYGQITNNVRLQDARLQQLLVDYQNTVLRAQQEVENGIASTTLPPGRPRL